MWPLNIDPQLILLHWMNLAILMGGLYFLLFKPVKKFMAQREEHYRELDRQTADKLAQAEELRARRQAELDGAAQEIHQAKAQAQQASAQAAREQLEQAQEQAQRVVGKAKAEAGRIREQALYDSQQDIRRLAEIAAQRLAFHQDPFDQFLDLAEGGKKHEGQ